MLLVISLLCLLLGCIFLWLELSQYGGLFQVKGTVSGVWDAALDAAARFV
jgi:hypothetical protein